VFIGKFTSAKPRNKTCGRSAATVITSPVWPCWRIRSKPAAWKPSGT